MYKYSSTVLLSMMLYIILAPEMENMHLRFGVMRRLQIIIDCCSTAHEKRLV